MIRLDDGRLLRRFVQQGDQNAFAEIIKRHYPMIFAVCKRDLERADLAEDAAQVVFLVLAHKAPKLASNSARLTTERERPASLAGWLYRTARFVSRSFQRSERRRQRAESDAAGDQYRGSAEREAWERIDPVLNLALEALRPAEREVVLLRYFEDCTYPEIGQHLGISADAASMRASRAIEKMARWLSRHGVPVGATALSMLLIEHAALSTSKTTLANVTQALLAAQSGDPIAGVALSAKSMEVIRHMFLAKVKVLVAAALLAAAIGIAAPKLFALTHKPATQTITGVLADQKQLSYQDSMMVQTDGGPVSHYIVTVSLERPNKMNIQLRQDGTLVGQVVSDGKTLYTIDDIHKTYRVEPAPANGLELKNHVEAPLLSPLQFTQPMPYLFFSSKQQPNVDPRELYMRGAPAALTDRLRSLHAAPGREIAIGMIGGNSFVAGKGKYGFIRRYSAKDGWSLSVEDRLTKIAYGNAILPESAFQFHAPPNFGKVY